jgi:hypothetical protein
MQPLANMCQARAIAKMMIGGTDQTDFLLGCLPPALDRLVGSTVAQGIQLQRPLRSLMEFTDVSESIDMPMHAANGHIFNIKRCQRFFGRDGLELLISMNLNLI